MTRSIALIALLLVAVPASELPPDLTHISGTGCHLRQYASDVLNAQTGKTDELHYVEVIAFVKFERTPAGENREEWTLSLGTYQATEEDPIPRETTDRCSGWMKKLKAAMVQEQHRRGHAAK